MHTRVKSLYHVKRGRNLQQTCVSNLGRTASITWVIALSLSWTLWAGRLRHLCIGIIMGVPGNLAVPVVKQSKTSMSTTTNRSAGVLLICPLSACTFLSHWGFLCSLFPWFRSLKWRELFLWVFFCLWSLIPPCHCDRWHRVPKHQWEKHICFCSGFL